MKTLLALAFLPLAASAQIQQPMLAPLGIPGVGSWNYPPQQVIVVPQPEQRNNLQQQIDMLYENQLIRNKELQNQILQRELNDASLEALGQPNDVSQYKYEILGR